MKTLTTIESQAHSGQSVDYRVCEHLNQISVEVYVNGKRYAGGVPKVVEEMVQGKYIYGKIVSVYLSKEEVWREVWEAYVAAKEQIESSEEYKAKQLRKCREGLAWDVKYAKDAQYEAEKKVVDMAMCGRSYKYNAEELQTKIDKAAKALAAFDKAHPEVIAVMEKERDERIERNMWM